MVLLLAVAVVVGLILAGAFREREPEYGGKRLSEWVVRHSRALNANSVRDKLEAAEALSHIGTNAIPFLLRWIRYEQPSWKTHLYRSIHPIIKRVGASWQLTDNNESRAIASANAFHALRLETKAAMPDLIQIMNDPKAGSSATRSVVALGFLGKDALPFLMMGFTNREPRIRVGVAGAIVLLGKDAGPAIPLLIRSLNDDCEVVADRAASALGELKLKPDLAIAALTKGLQDPRIRVRQHAARALGEFGPEASPALPALMNSFQNPDFTLRKQATNAVRKIDSGRWKGPGDK